MGSKDLTQVTELARQVTLLARLYFSTLKKEYPMLPLAAHILKLEQYRD